MIIDNIDVASELGDDLARFSVDELKELALQQVIPEVASHALSALEDRDTISARTSALEILSRPSWDIWLEAQALDVLCRGDIEAAWRVMDQLLSPVTDSYFLQAMGLNVESELQVFTSGFARAFASRLADEVRGRDISQFDKPDEVAAFLERFSSKT